MLSHPVPRPLARLLLIVCIVAAGLVAGAMGGYIVHESHLNCLSNQSGWENKRDAWIELTEPTPFTSSTDPERAAAEQAINDRLSHIRAHLLVGLGPRPSC